MLEHRSQFPQIFRDRKSRKKDTDYSALPDDIYKEMLERWNHLGTRARDYASMSKEEMSFLGLKPTDKKSSEDLTTGMGVWTSIINKNIPHKDLHKNLSWLKDSLFKSDQKRLAKASIRCSLGNNIKMEDGELNHNETRKVYYSRFKEDIRDPYTLLELNDRDCKVVHFPQVLWPKEHLEVINAIRLIQDCINNPVYYRSLNLFTVKQELKDKARTAKEAIGYRSWYFDIDQKRFTIDTLKFHIKEMGLYDYLKTIVMTSSGRFHVYFNADLKETAHWNPFEPVTPEIKKAREKFVKLWDKLAEVLSADVGKALTQKASTPGYRNPRTGEIASVVHRQEKPKKLTLKRAKNIVLGIFGEEVVEAQAEVIEFVPRIVTASSGIPTFQQYNDYHNYGDTIVSTVTLNEKVKKLTTHIHRYLPFPFSQTELNEYFNKVVLPAFKPGEEDESRILAKFEDWVENASRFARTSGFKNKRYITQKQIDEIDEFLAKFQTSIQQSQASSQMLTPKQEIKIPRLMLQIRQALLDPQAKLKIEDGCLVGKIPCKYLKGPENGLGRYNELIKALCRMGLIHRDVRYSRPHKLPNAQWAGEARTWKFYLEPQEPQNVDSDIWSHSYHDYQYWMGQEEKPLPDWVHNYQRSIAA